VKKPFSVIYRQGNSEDLMVLVERSLIRTNASVRVWLTAVSSVATA